MKRNSVASPNSVPTEGKNTAATVKKFVGKHMLELILILLIVVVSFTSSSFLTTGNLFNILRSMSMTGIIAFGMTFVIIAGEIDLSVGSTVALSGVIVALVSGGLSSVMPMEIACAVGILISLVVCALIGLFNGFLLTRFKMPSFIITLGMMNLLYGVAAVISKGFPVTTLPSWYRNLGAGMLFGVIPVPALFLLAVFVITFIVMKYMKFGRSVYRYRARNPESARLSGINTAFVKIAVMIIVQVCRATARHPAFLPGHVRARFSFGKGWEMTAISAVIIGGASLSGGTGKIWGTFLGLIFLGVISNAMTLNGVDDYVQYIVQGVLIIGAVLINCIQSRRKSA